MPPNPPNEPISLDAVKVLAAAVIDSDGHRFPCPTTADLAEAVRSGRM
jgi:hypothetical protein